MCVENINHFVSNLEQIYSIPKYRCYYNPCHINKIYFAGGLNFTTLPHPYAKRYGAIANDIGSYINKFPMDLPGTGQRGILYSGSYSGQNRAMFEKVSKDHPSIEIIDHKFLRCRWNTILFTYI